MSIKQTAIALRDGYVSRQVRRAKLPDFPPAPIRRVRLTFLGRVQKVGFRQEVTELAQGWTSPGSVKTAPTARSWRRSRGRPTGSSISLPS